jgi:hypothetical protein
MSPKENVAPRIFWAPRPICPNVIKQSPFAFFRFFHVVSVLER